MCEILKKTMHMKILKKFFEKYFIEKYIKNLLSSELINEKDDFFKLTNKGKYFYLFLKKVLIFYLND